MGKKRCRPSVIVPYHVYHFKDMRREFDFVCLKDMGRDDLWRESSGRLYNVMMLNHRKVRFSITFHIKNDVKNEDYQCGTIECWYMEVGDVTLLLEKSAYTENAIKLAKLMYM